MAQANSDTIAMIRDKSICDKSIVNDKKIPFRLSTKADKQLVGNKRVMANSDTEFKEYAYGTYTHGASENVYSEFYGREIPNLFGRYAPSKSYGTVLYRSSENPNVYKISPWLNEKELFFEMDASGNISIQFSFTGFYGSSKGDDIFATDAFDYLGEHPSLYNKNGGVFDLYILFQSNGGVYGLDHDRFTITGYSGTCGKNTGDNVIWELNPETGELLIRGWGEMEDYVETSETGNVILQRPWEEYANIISTIRVTEGVTNVGEGAFAFLTGVENVELSSSVETMSYAAFYGCSALTSLVLPNSLKAIGNYVFSDCSSLTSLVLPNSVETIGSSAFSGCSALTSLVLPNSVKTIGEVAFDGCLELESIEIGNSVETIGQSAFSNCSSLASLVLPNSVETIGDYAFYGCSALTRLVLPNSITSIGRAVVYACSSLTDLAIPQSVTSIGDYAINRCSSLKSISIPNSVETIGYAAFYGCSELMSVEMGNSVTTIGYGGFGGCTKLESVKMLGEVPPTAFDNTFSNYDATLYVPVGASNTYRAADVWQNFSLIEEFETTGIEDINAIADKEVTVYTTSGTLVLRVPNYNGEPLPLPTGVYVVRTGNASKKVVVK